MKKLYYKNTASSVDLGRPDLNDYCDYSDVGRKKQVVIKALRVILAHIRGCCCCIVEPYVCGYVAVGRRSVFGSYSERRDDGTWRKCGTCNFDNLSKAHFLH